MSEFEQAQQQKEHIVHKLSTLQSELKDLQGEEEELETNANNTQAALNVIMSGTKREMRKSLFRT